MSTKNKKSIASQALLEMDAIKSALKEESKNTLNSLLAEAVRSTLRESCEEEEEKDYEVVDAESDTEDTEIDSENSVESESTEDEGEETQDNGDFNSEEEESNTEDAPSDGENEEWNEFSDYQSDEDTYDLTGENDYEKVVKVFKLLKDEDQIVIKKDGDKVHVKDNENDTEYVIDFGEEDENDYKDTEDYNNEEENDINNINESEIAGFDDEFEDNNEDFEIEIDNEESEIENLKKTIEQLNNRIEDLENGGNIENKIYENKKSRKPMKESKEMLFEVDLGYTDNYQDKDPIAGLSNNEPSKSGKSWHKGLPTGTNKPWAGETKSKGQPFEKTVNEEDEMTPDMSTEMPMDEAATSTSTQSFRKATKSRTSEPRREHAPSVTKKMSTAQRGYEEVVAENKKLKRDVKELKEAILAIRKNLSEAYVTNANLGKITKLFLENTTSQSEKIEIVNRFSNEAKTIEQSKALYESIKRELNKTNKSLNINESMTAKGTSAINETKVYKSDDLIKTIDFMNRIMKI